MVIAFVFDFDETLGNFLQFSELCMAIESMYNVKLGPDEYAYLLKIFPRYVRSGMLDLLRELAAYRRRYGCKIVIYTNNQGGRKWVRDVAQAIGLLVDEPKLFDRILYAYKFDVVGNANVSKSNYKGETCRTSHEKRHDDFLACTRYHSNTRIVFVDDMMHTKMVNPHVSYVHVSEYRWNYDRNYIIQMCKQYDVIPSGHDAVLARSLPNRKPSTLEQHRHHARIGVLLEKFFEAYISSLRDSTLAGGAVMRIV